MSVSVWGKPVTAKAETQWADVPVDAFVEGKTETGPDANGIKTITEYKLNDRGLKVRSLEIGKSPFPRRSTQTPPLPQRESPMSIFISSLSRSKS